MAQRGSSHVLLIGNPSGLLPSEALGEDHKHPLDTDDTEQHYPTELSAGMEGFRVCVWLPY